MSLRTSIARAASVAAVVAPLFGGVSIQAAPPAAASASAEPDTIHFYIERGEIAKVEKLLARHPALKEQRQAYLGTPLAVAAENGKAQLVKYLVTKGANVNARCPDEYDSQTVLMAACRGVGVPVQTRLQIVKTLVDRGALVRVVDRSGYTALHTAAYWGHADLVGYLLLKGADLMAMDGDGRTPFTEALRGASMWDDWRLVRFIRMAVAEGADVNARVASGDTMLHLAVKSGKVNTVDFLLAQHADVNAQDRTGRTPLTVALQRGQTEVAGLLRKSGAKEAQPVLAAF
jgi:ankyrin repeat protein